MNLVLISSVLAFIGPVIYTVSILRGRSKPHRTTRLVLFLISTLGTLSFFLVKDYANFWLFISYALGNLILFLLSIKYGMGGWSKSDIVCLLIALVGIIVWQISGNPLTALYASVIADFTGMIPALRKTYAHPETEIWPFYFCDILATLLIIVAHKHITFNELLYPLYLLVINATMIIFIIRPRPNLAAEKQHD